MIRLIAYIISGIVVGAGLAYSFVDLGVGLLVALVSGTVAVAIANDIKKDWNNRE
jgi:hypothetical protein